MANINKRVGYTAWGICLAGGTALGIIGAAGAEQAPGPDPLRADIERAEELGLEHDLNYDRVVVDLGETCFALIDDYLPGAELAGTSETDVVGDMLQSETQPCGDDATEVRHNVRDLFDADQKVRDNRDRTVALEEESAAMSVNNEEDGPSDIENIAIGVGGGFVAGAYVGFMASIFSGLIRQNYEAPLFMRQDGGL